MSKDISSKELLDFIRSKFSRFDQISDVDDGMYSALGDYAIYLRDGITEGRLPDLELRQAVSIFDTMAQSTDPEVKNLLMVGVLEILADEMEVVDFFRKQLKSEANTCIDIVTKE